MSEEQGGGPCGWSRVSEGEREEMRAGRIRGRLCRALWTSGTWVFPRREVGILEDCGQRRDLIQVLNGALWWLLWRGQTVGTRAEETELVQVGHDGAGSGWR